MIENSLTYQFGDGVTMGNDQTPEAMIITRTDGTSLRYVPEVVLPNPVFKRGQIVRIVTPSALRYNWQGVITWVGGEFITVEFGIALEGHLATSFSRFRSGNLEVIHEVE